VRGRGKNRRGAAPRKSGRASTAAVGAKRRQEAAKREAADRAAKLPPPVTRPPVRVRAAALLEAHKIPIEPATLEVASDLFAAGDLADHLYLECLGTSGESAARLGSAMATLLKQRRQQLKDLGLPNDPDERDDLGDLGAAEPASAKPAATKSTEKKPDDLDRYLDQ